MFALFTERKSTFTFCSRFRHCRTCVQLHILFSVIIYTPLSHRSVAYRIIRMYSTDLFVLNIFVRRRAVDDSTRITTNSFDCLENKKKQMKRTKTKTTATTNRRINWECRILETNSARLEHHKLVFIQSVKLFGSATLSNCVSIRVN